MSVTLEDEDEVVEGLDADGRADPDYARALGIIPASAGLRSLSFAIDAVIVLILTLPLSLGTLPLWLNAILSAPSLTPSTIIANDAFIAGLVWYLIGQGAVSIFILVQVALHGVKGVTVGKALVGIRSVNVTTFTKAGFWRIALRALVLWTALGIIPIIGAVPFLLSPLWDSEKRGRGWLDLIGRNWLIDIRRGLDPFNSKDLRHARKRLSAKDAAPVVPMPSLATGDAGAVASFVPSSRSRSGVIRANSFAPEEDRGWQPPPVGAPSVQPNSVHDRETLVEEPVGPQLKFDDGLRVPITGVGLIGRGPQASESETIDHLITITDDTFLLSKTHASFGMDNNGVWVVDRGSVNGTVVQFPNGDREQLVAWQRHRIAANSVVEVGGRSFTLIVNSETNGREA